MNSKVISLLEYKLKKLDKRLGEEANTYDNLTESINNYNKSVKNFKKNLFKNTKQQYRDLEKLIGEEFKDINEKELIFDWKRRKSTL